VKCFVREGNCALVIPVLVPDDDLKMPQLVLSICPIPFASRFSLTKITTQKNVDLHHI
jgi:hypothetical protein